MASRTLTTLQLIDAGASVAFVDDFRSKFGDSVEINPDFLAERFMELDTATLANLLLSGDNKALFGTATSVSNGALAAALASAQAAYDAAVLPGQRVVKYGLAQVFGRLYLDEAPPSPPPPPVQDP